MRKVTDSIVTAFYNGKSKKVGNTHTDGEAIYLHGHCIARKVEGGIEITNCGYFTSTTKERLNGLDGVSINQKDCEWYLNGKTWDGTKTVV